MTKIGVMQLDVSVEFPRKSPVNPPEMKHNDKTDRKEHAGCKTDIPLPDVVSQLKTLSQRDCDQQVSNTNTRSKKRFNPVTTCGAPRTRKAST